MSDDTRLELARKLVVAFENNDLEAAETFLDNMAGMHKTQLFQEVGRLTRQLHDTMSNFTADSKIASITEFDIPNAQERLRYVITMTEQAANQTLTVVESLLPVSENLNEQANHLSEKWERFLGREMPFGEFKELSGELTQHFKSSTEALASVQSGLTEILLAQGFQDITGQIIRKVIDLVQELEESLVGLIRVTGLKNASTPQAPMLREDVLPGPVVPGVDDKLGDTVSNQDDVDDLLSSLGF